MSEQKPATAPPITDAQWDELAVRCGNCQLEIIARNGEIPGNNGLSDVGHSGDEALCGRCAGAEMYRLMDEADKRDAQPAPRISAEALAEMRRFTREWKAPQIHGGVDPSYINGVIGGFGAMTHHMERWAQQPEEKRS
jgi:hypothetical protein